MMILRKLRKKPKENLNKNEVNVEFMFLFEKRAFCIQQFQAKIFTKSPAKRIKTLKLSKFYYQKL
jgi:hypothetical protein